MNTKAISSIVIEKTPSFVYQAKDLMDNPVTKQLRDHLVKEMEFIQKKGVSSKVVKEQVGRIKISSFGTRDAFLKAKSAFVKESTLEKAVNLIEEVLKLHSIPTAFAKLNSALKKSIETTNWAKDTTERNFKQAAKNLESISKNFKKMA